jgi:hypothetical protein
VSVLERTDHGLEKNLRGASLSGEMLDDAVPGMGGARNQAGWLGIAGRDFELEPCARSITPHVSPDIQCVPWGRDHRGPNLALVNLAIELISVEECRFERCSRECRPCSVERAEHQLR